MSRGNDELGSSTEVRQIRSEFHEQLLKAARTHPRARLTRRTRIIASFVAITAVGLPAGAIALDGDASDEPFVPSEERSPDDLGRVAPPTDDSTDEMPTLEPIGTDSRRR